MQMLLSKLNYSSNKHGRETKRTTKMTEKLNRKRRRRVDYRKTRWSLTCLWANRARPAIHFKLALTRPNSGHGD